MLDSQCLGRVVRSDSSKVVSRQWSVFEGRYGWLSRLCERRATHLALVRVARLSKDQNQCQEHVVQRWHSDLRR